MKTTKRTTKRTTTTTKSCFFLLVVVLFCSFPFPSLGRKLLLKSSEDDEGVGGFVFESFNNGWRRALLETDDVGDATTSSSSSVNNEALEPKYSATNPMDLFGAGATFPAVAYKSCARAYSLIKPSVRVKYLDVGSGKGICRILNATTECVDTEEPLEVDFACSDSLISASQYSEFPDVQMYPVVAGAVTPVYNLPDDR